MILIGEFVVYAGVGNEGSGRWCGLDGQGHSPCDCFSAVFVVVVLGGSGLLLVLVAIVSVVIIWIDDRGKPSQNRQCYDFRTTTRWWRLSCCWCC